MHIFACGSHVLMRVRGDSTRFPESTAADVSVLPHSQTLTVLGPCHVDVFSVMDCSSVTYRSQDHLLELCDVHVV